jgi:uncharacterized protein YhbP (UPF0306 family)
VPIERSKRPVGARRIAAVAQRLLEASQLCAVATVSSDGRAYVNTAYFAWSPEFELVWLSHPQARHSRNIAANGTVAIAVYDSTQSWGNPDRGIQLFGSAREVEGRAAAAAQAVYAARFDGYEPGSFATYRMYRFRPRRLKVFDERVLGSGVFVTARVAAGRPAWERTELYRQ